MSWYQFVKSTARVWVNRTNDRRAGNRALQSKIESKALSKTIIIFSVASVVITAKIHLVYMYQSVNGKWNFLEA